MFVCPLKFLRFRIAATITVVGPNTMMTIMTTTKEGTAAEGKSQIAATEAEVVDLGTTTTVLLDQEVVQGQGQTAAGTAIPTFLKASTRISFVMSWPGTIWQ